MQARVAGRPDGVVVVWDDERRQARTRPQRGGGLDPGRGDRVSRDDTARSMPSSHHKRIRELTLDLIQPPLNSLRPMCRVGMPRSGLPLLPRRPDRPDGGFAAGGRGAQAVLPPRLGERAAGHNGARRAARAIWGTGRRRTTKQKRRGWMRKMARSVETALCVAHASSLGALLYSVFRCPPQRPRIVCVSDIPDATAPCRVCSKRAVAQTRTGAGGARLILILPVVS